MIYNNELVFAIRAIQKCFRLIGLFILAFSCNSTPTNLSNNSITEIDSVSFWINSSSKKSINIETRKKHIYKAYNYTDNTKNDSLKNISLLKIAFQAYKLNDTLLFKKVNRESQDLSIRLKDTFGIADTHWNYGNFYSDNEVMDSAYYHFYQAFENFQAIRHNYFSGKMLYNMAIIQKDIKDYTGSEISIFNAISIFKKLDKYLNLYYCNNLLGIIYNELQEYDKAIIYHTKALENLELVENKLTFKELSLNNMGLVYHNKKEYKKAIEQFKNALKNDNLKKEDIYNYTRLIDNLAYTKIISGDTINVIHDMDSALKIRDSLNNFSGIILSKLHLAEYYAVTTDTTKAIVFTKDASALATKVNNNKDKLAALKLLSKLDKSNANKYLKEYIILNDSLQSQERKTRNKFTRIRFETDEYIEETEKLSQKISVIVVVGAISILILALLYIVKIQRAKNKELLFEKEQQKSNEEIYALLLKQQSKLEEGRLKERTRIAEELHDGVLGKIFGTRMSFGFLSLKGDTETIGKHNALINELKEVEKEIRDISHELKNELLSQQNFNTIVEELLKKNSSIGSFKYSITCEETINWNVIDGNIKINCYRIIQEAIQNCNKHAKATHINIDFTIYERNLKLVIKDNGVGFDITKKKKGIGLKNIQSRSLKIQADFTMSSSMNEGTILILSIPI